MKDVKDEQIRFAIHYEGRTVERDTAHIYSYAHPPIYTYVYMYIYVAFGGMFKEYMHPTLDNDLTKKKSV